MALHLAERKVFFSDWLGLMAIESLFEVWCQLCEDFSWSNFDFLFSGTALFLPLLATF